MSELRQDFIQTTSVGIGSVPVALLNDGTVKVREEGNGILHRTVFTLASLLVTLVKNGTSTGGGGTKIYDFPEGLILPLVVSSNLTVTNAGDGSFLASLGTAVAGTDGSLSSTEANFAPSTAATVSSGTGTCKMKSTSSSPTPGSPLDGTGTAIDLYLNAALNANATGKESLYVSGTIEVVWIGGGDN